MKVSTTEESQHNEAKNAELLVMRVISISAEYVSIVHVRSGNNEHMIRFAFQNPGKDVTRAHLFVSKR